MTMAGVNVREVTEIDRRTASRIEGMTASQVNQVMQVWAEEYLRFERENPRAIARAVSEAVTVPKRAPRKNLPGSRKHVFLRSGSYADGEGAELCAVEGCGKPEDAAIHRERRRQSKDESNGEGTATES